jgi:hypothetical protein
VVAGVLSAIGLLAYGSYIAHGGFYADDWSNAAGYHFADSPRYWNSVSDLAGDLGGRPLLAVNPRATLKYLMDQRRPLYASVATHTLATDGRTPEELAEELAALLKNPG